MVAKSVLWPSLGLPASGLVLARNGSDEETDLLIRSVWPHAYRIAFSILRDHGLAEDAAQEACAVVFRSIQKLRAPPAFSVWFYRIVVRTALKIHKSRGPSAEQLDPEVVGSSDLSGSLVRIDVMRAFKQLTPRQRAAIVLHYYARMSSREIATILGIPDSTVRFHIMNAKKMLERLLQDRIVAGREDTECSPSAT